MIVVDVLRETFAGLKMGARYSVSKSHNLTENAVQPRLKKLGTENFGR